MSETPQDDTPTTLTARYEALERIVGFNDILWLSLFALWRCEHERTGQGLTYETVEPLTGLGQFLTAEIHTQLHAFHAHILDLGQRSEDSLQRAYTLIQEHKDATAAEEKKE